MEYNVLWIDDLWETQKDIIGEAEQEGLNVFPFESSEEGMRDLNNKLDFYHAVILDAKVKNKKVDTKTGLDGLRASRDELIELNQKIYLPYFIFTGQPDYTSSVVFKQSYGDYFIKGQDNDKLYKAIKEAISKSPEQKARKQFKEVFECFDLGILNNTAKKLFLDIVENLSSRNFKKRNIGGQRDLLESIFKSLNDPIPCIPNSFFDPRLEGKPNQEWCVRYLEGRPTRGSDGVEKRIDHNIPKDIHSSFRKLKESVNKLSHLSDETEVKLPFLANTYLLMEIMNWLPDFVERNYRNYI